MARKLRDYEVSIWTLQDEFITVLKPSHLEHKGQLIGKDNLDIKDDGTRSVSFSIPMYIYQGAERKENPIWHTTKDGTIVTDMRKIKVIFNKDDSGQDGIAEKDNVFEFIITDVVERHEQDQLYCDITCDGLAFHELGKVGYKISLSSEEFYNNDYDWFTNGSWTDVNGVAHSEQPIANLQYWVNQFLEPVPETIVDRTQWYYEVRMNWKSYADGTTRDSDKVYEEEYAASWIEQNGLLVPGSTVHSAEKTRMVELEESNKYNLTQDIAKTFEVFCRYQYLYDDNYHIIGRKVIFYNSYMVEDTGYLDLTYPYSTSAITRERDSKDLTTKMFVRPVDNDASASGMITIMETEANKSREDYLLNFDYLHSIGAVTDEQYDEISLYETHMAQCNKQLEQLSVALSVLQDKKIELEAAIKTAEDSIPLDLERIEAASQLYNNLVKLHGDDEGRGIAITEASPHSAIPLKDSNAADGSYYITFNIMGILPGTVNIYTTYNSVNKSLSGALSKTWRNEFDDEGNLVAIRKLPAPASSASYYYLTFTYSPKLYYDKVIQTWQKRLGEDKHIKETSDAELIEVNNNIDIFQTQYDDWLTRKKKYVKDFEKMMGPALRESYWQPEDYLDYGDMYNESLMMPTLNITSSTIADNELSSIIWDSNLFDNEQEGTYEYSVIQTVKSYPYIVVNSDILALLADNANSLENLCYYYYDYPTSNPVRDITSLKMYPLTSLCTFSFITRNTNVVQPVILLTGYSGQRSSLMKAENNYGIGRYDLSTNTLTSLLTGFTVAADDNHTEVKAYYPRIKISSLNLKTSSDQLVVKYNGEELTNYEDYYIVARDDSTVDNGTINIDTAYYITIKPIVYYKAGTFNGTVDIKYSISNADVSIYLDAIKVLKENSMPKVSYTIDLSASDDEFIYKAYNKLSQIANINDTDLKFENMQGYISELQLNLDKPWEDKIIIKNYKTKFEDLFSTIVAQTEEMRKNAFAIERAGEVLTQDGITPEALESTLLNPRSINIMDAYLNAGFDDYSVVEEVLKNAFDQAGEIIAAANSTLGSLRTLNTKNASILAGFAENIAAALTPTVYTGQTRPTTFKPGDIWIETNEDGEEIGRYISMNNSDLLSDDAQLSDIAGWTQTYDGSLAAITGASLVVNAETGTINLLAENELNVATGGSLKLAGEAVNIIGNQVVNIGGAVINIASESNNINKLGGIHLIAAKYDDLNTKIDSSTSSISRVDMDANGITLASKNGIVIKSAAGIDIKYSDVSSTSAIRINREDGIYLGSTTNIKLFSGDVGGTGSAASVEINKDHILFGVGNSTSGTAAEFTKQRIIFAAGTTAINNIATGSVTTNGENSGVLITKDKIGFAIGTNDARRSIIMDSDGIVVASGIHVDVSTHTGSYVRISPTGIDLGSSGNLYINTSNVQLQTEGNGISGTRFALGTNLNDSDVDNRQPKLVFDKDGNLSITGTVNASSGIIGGWALTNAKFYSNSPITQDGETINRYVVLNSARNATTAIWAGGTSYTSITDNPPFRVTYAGKLYARNAEIKGAIIATSFELDDGVTIPQSSIENLTDDLNDIPETTTISYARHDNGTTPPISTSSAWKSSLDQLPALTNNNRYLWTRTVIITKGNTSSTSYSVSYIAKDGEAAAQGASVSTMTPLYRLTNSSTVNQPTTKVTYNEDTVNRWTLIVPTYRSGYTYYRCEQYELTNGDIGWSDVYVDYGLTVANSTATTASTTASAVATSIEPITTNGLSSGTWNGVDYGVILGNTNTSKPMLIGSNSGITIANADKNGSAIVLDSSGIALHGAAINLTSSSNISTSVIALNENGVEIGATGYLQVLTTNFRINSSSTGTNAILRLGTEGNPLLKYSLTNGLEITGNVTADTGRIGGWTLRSNRLYNISTKTVDGVEVERYVVLNSASNANAAIWAGNNSYSSTSGAPFIVTYDGVLTATNAHITGEITATSGQIGSWVLNDNYLESSDHTLGLDARSGVTTAIWIGGNGSTRTSAPFRVTRAGEVIASKLTITQANSASNTQGIGIVSTPVYASGSTTKQSSDTTDTQYYLWVGKETPGESNFRVTTDGKAYVNNLYIKNSGNYIDLVDKLNSNNGWGMVTGVTTGTSGYVTDMTITGYGTVNFTNAGGYNSGYSDAVNTHLLLVGTSGGNNVIKSTVGDETLGYYSSKTLPVTVEINITGPNSRNQWVITATAKANNMSIATATSYATAPSQS